jgi:hypothetical protein
MWNLSCYSSGMMGYSTPNIDRVAKEGLRFARGDERRDQRRASLTRATATQRREVGRLQACPRNEDFAPANRLHVVSASRNDGLRPIEHDRPRPTQ